MNKLLLTLIAAGAALCTSAQKLSVAQVKETRSTNEGYFSNSCDVYIKLSGDELRKYTFVRIAEITKATDDQDADMINEKEKDFLYRKVNLNVQIPVSLKSSSRKAASIKALQGSLKLYAPSETNGSLFTVKGFQNKPNVNLLPAGLPVKIFYVNPESAQSAAARPAGKKDTVKKRPGGPEGAMGEAFIAAFQGMFGGSDDDPNQLRFLVEGDRKKLVDIKFRDETGQQIDRPGKMESGNKISYRFRSKPAPGWSVILYIESEGSVKTIPFSFTDLELP